MYTLLPLITIPKKNVKITISDSLALFQLMRRTDKATWVSLFIDIRKIDAYSIIKFARECPAFIKKITLIYEYRNRIEQPRIFSLFFYHAFKEATKNLCPAEEKKVTFCKLDRRQISLDLETFGSDRQYLDDEVDSPHSPREQAELN